MKKKFKVRVKHFSKNYYTVEYAYYYFFPTWIALSFWFSQFPNSGTEGWSTKLFSYKEAEKIAVGLLSIDDVRNYYKPHEEEKAAFERDKEKFYKENAPYKTKYF